MKRKSKKALLLLLVLIFTLVPAPFVRSEGNGISELQHKEEVEEANRLAFERQRVVAITSTIALLETAGTLDCSQHGLSGERGCHQFMPDTWHSYSSEVLGYVATQTPEAATEVTEGMVKKWLDEGKSPRQIFLIWNQGHPGKCSSGVNRYGVRYDSCGYADKALNILSTQMAG